MGYLVLVIFEYIDKGRFSQKMHSALETREGVLKAVA